MTAAQTHDIEWVTRFRANVNWAASVIHTSETPIVGIGDSVVPRFDQSSNGAGSEKKKGNSFGEHGYDSELNVL